MVVSKTRQIFLVEKSHYLAEDPLIEVKEGRFLSDMLLSPGKLMFTFKMILT